MNDNEIWVDGKDFVMVEGARPPFALVIEDATSISSPSVKLFKNGTDVTSIYITGSATTNGTNTIVAPVIGSLLDLPPDDSYVVHFKATVNGAVDIREMRLIVKKAGKAI